MKKLLIYISIISFFGSCSKSILEKVDLNGIEENVVYNNEAAATQVLNNIYSIVLPVWPCDYNTKGTTLPTSFHNTSDESNAGYTNMLYGTLTAESITDFYAGGGNTNAYGYIRKINIFLNGIDAGNLSGDVKTKLKAQAYFLRAWVYFELVKLYGGVPYITKVQDWQTDDLMVFRNKTSECIDSMVTDLEKCSVLPATWGNGSDKGRITRGAAAAVKAKILMYWASPQFSLNPDLTRWERAYQANKNAYDTLQKDGYALYPDFSKIFMNIAANDDNEPILYRAYNGTSNQLMPGLFNTYENSRPYSESNGSGGQTNNPTWDLVKAFPMSNGVAISDAHSGYDSVYYWKNRDPRFAATIAYNGCVWPLSSQTGRKQWNYDGITKDNKKPTLTGFYCRKNIDASLSAANSAFGKTFWVEMRLAEVMLNLAECANATGRLQEAYDLLTAIRKRAGILAGTDNLYGLKANMTSVDMNDAIQQERRIEFAFEGKRYDDLRRTLSFSKLNGKKRMALVITPKVSVSFLETKVNGVAPLDTLDVNGPAYETYFTATVQPIPGESVINYLKSYYFYAIPTTNITKDPNLKQNIGWNYSTTPGTFDPLQ